MTALARTCPFCGAKAESRSCPGCNRDTTAPRRPCASCAKMMPLADASCPHCGASQKSELRWKIPLIIALFVIAFILSIVLHSVR